MRAILLVASLTIAHPAGADPLGLDRPDLHAHAWLSYGIALTLTEVFEGPEPAWGPAWGTDVALLVASGAVAALGLAKEYLIDDRADRADLLADAIGIGANVVLQYTIQF